MTKTSKTVTMATKIPAHWESTIERLARYRGVTKSELIRSAVLREILEWYCEDGYTLDTDSFELARKPDPYSDWLLPPKSR